MSRPEAARSRALFASIIAAVLAAAVAVIGSVNRPFPPDDGEPLRAERVVLFTIPGVTWADVISADTPMLDRLIREGATAALAPRTAGAQPSAIRGYITLGAGNRGAAPGGNDDAQRAYMFDEQVNGVRAEDMLSALVPFHVEDGAIAHLGYPRLERFQAAEYHGAVVGALGQALEEAGIHRSVVSAADHGIPKDADAPEAIVERRGGPTLAMVDTAGVIRNGKIGGLLEKAPGWPYGVRTDASAFLRATASQLRRNRVVHLEPGETLRADVFATDASPDRASSHRRRALESTDALLGSVVDLLEPDDLLLVVGSSSTGGTGQEHHTPIVVWGNGIDRGALVSATTHRPGVVTLTDVAPTVLDLMGVDEPESMSGRPMRVTSDEGMDRPQHHDDLDRQAVFRDTWSPSVFYAFVGLFVVLSLLIALVFLFRVQVEVPLAGVCYLILAVPLATFAITALPLWRVGSGAAHVVLWSLSAVFAGAGWLVGGPRWVGAVPLFVALATFEATALVMDGRLIINAIFGNSTIVAGRFYGIGNTGWALLFGSAVLALAGVGEILRARRWNVWFAIGLLAVLILTGAPQFGADVGGLLTGVAAVIVILVVGREGRIPWKAIMLGLLAAVVVTLLVGYMDSLRAADQQTHLGRFVESLFAGNASTRTTIWRKATQAIDSLSISRFSYIVLLGVAALGVLLRRPRGPLRDVLPSYPLFRAAFAGLLVAGVLGFLLNDSGVVVPALLLAQGVPLVVVMGVDHSRV